MSLKSTEAVQVKIEPLCSEDDAEAEPESERQAYHIHHEVKKELNWNIDPCLTASQGRTLKNDQMCNINTQALPVENEMRDETVHKSEVAKSSRYTRDHVVKVERGTDDSGVSKIATQVDMFTGNSSQINHTIKKEWGNEGRMFGTKETAMPTGIYMDQMVNIKRKLDDSEENEAVIQGDLVTEKTSQMQSKLGKASHTNQTIKEESGNEVSMFNTKEVATPTSLYLDHMVKLEREGEDFRISKTVTSNTSLMEKKIKKEWDNEAGMFSGSEVNKPTGLYKDHVESKTDVCSANKDKGDHTSQVHQMQDSKTAVVRDESAATPLAELYLDHEVKEELVLGPEVLHRANVPNQVSLNRTESDTVTGKSCSVILEKMHVDMERGVCRIGCNTYKFRPHLQNHKDSEKQTEKIRNEFCKTLQNDQNKRKSKKTNAQEKPYKCDHCNYATTEKHRLTVHGKRHSGDRPFKCVLCNYASAYKAHLEIHERTHMTDKPYKCDRCSYACIQKCDLLVHQRIHTGEKPYKCEHCDFACNRKRDLLLHERTHTGEKPFKCEHCDYASIRKRDLLVHANTHAIINGQENDEKIYKCDHCSYTTCRKHDWMVHERRLHKSDKPFKCDQCNYAVSCKTSLLKHVKKHTGEQVEKRYKCSHCNYSSDHKNHMLVHQRKHTGEKPYKCRHCVYATAYKRDLLVHEALHTSEKPHKCSQCSYACANVSNLRIHEKVHLGENANKRDGSVSVNLMKPVCSEDICNNNENVNTKLIDLTVSFQL